LRGWNPEKQRIREELESWIICQLPEGSTLIRRAQSAYHVAGLERDLVSLFLRELTEAARVTLHVRLLHGEDAEHALAAIFKALGGAIARAAEPSGKE
jgi:imidazoleglycerol phosphate dehydratase HisB